ELDDSGWPEVDVPGHWRSSPAFAEEDGPVLYRRQFDFPRQAPDRGVWLTLEGLFYLGDVWLDGAYVGDTEGYFFPHTFDVTQAMLERREHRLAVEVTCSPSKDRTAKRNITGVFEHWDGLDPDWNPGGIWRPVRLHDTGTVRITRLRTLCREATEVRAVVGFTAELDAAEATTVTLRTTIGGTDHEVEHPLATGANKVEWTVTVARPALWWPHALGGQPLCDVAVEVLTEPNELSDRRAFRPGLREAVDLLGHHPSVALWCGHNEPLTLDPEQGVRLGRLVASMELPTWNKTVLDHSVSRALETADPTRPVIAHSGVWPSLGSGGTDAHLYFG